MKFATAVVIAIYAMVAYASAAVPREGGGGGGGGGGGSSDS